MCCLVIRAARPDEYDDVGELTLAAYQAQGPVGSYASELRDVAGRANHGDLLVATDDAGALVGTASVFVRRGPWTELAEDGDAEIRMLAVDPAVRNRGIGRALAEACIERARTAGARRVVLSTQPRTVPAHRIYQRLGFTRRPDLDWSPRPGVQLLGYVLPLVGQ